MAVIDRSILKPHRDKLSKLKSGKWKHDKVEDWKSEIHFITPNQIDIYISYINKNDPKIQDTVDFLYSCFDDYSAVVDIAYKLCEENRVLQKALRNIWNKDW